jgi:hypothetical protein
MKLKTHYIILLALALGIQSCKKDNYEAPSSTLNGRIMYNGEEIGLEFNQVPVELYQLGFGKSGAIATTFGQDGTYSSLLFDGNYKLIIPNGQGPFRWQENAGGGRDTLDVSVRGNQTLDLEATPYFMVHNAAYTLSGTTLSATCRVDQIITGVDAKTIESVTLFINKTMFVSRADNIANTELAAAAITDPSNVNFSVTVPTITPTQNYVFARIGLKISGVEDMIFSPLEKIQL